MISYQGLVKVSGVPYNGTGYFKFAVVDAAGGGGTANNWASVSATDEISDMPAN